MTWTPSSLTKGYKRRVAGFDLRVDPAFEPISDPLAPCHGSWNLICKDKSLSVDDLIWRRVYGKEDRILSNGLGLFDTTEVLNTKLQAFPEPKLIIAIDLPDSLLPYSQKHQGVCPVDVDLPNLGFSFLGYDVASWWGKSSGFYSYDWEQKAMHEFLVDQSIVLNERGLVESEDAAIRAAIWFSGKFTEDAPFAPFGLWGKKHRGNDLAL